MKQTTVLALASLLTTTLPSHATFLTYSEWEALPPESAELYIAGMVDALTNTWMGQDDVKTFQGYQSCIAQSRMTDLQLAQNVKVFASTRPELHTRPVNWALVQYLAAACPKSTH